MARFRLALIASAALMSGEALAAGDIALGEYLAATCVSCHQKSGQVTGGVPAIVGWQPEQFIAVMNAYRSKERESEVMRSISASLSAEDIAALAAYFGSLKPAH